MTNRLSSLAGVWYDADASRLRSEIDGWLDEAERPGDRRVRALLLPHAGYRWSGRVAAQAVAAVRGRSFRRVVVMGPSHHARLEDVIALPAPDAIQTPLGVSPIEAAALDRLEGDVFRRIPRAHTGEHSVEIELPLLQRALGAFAVVPLVVGDLSSEVAARAAKALLGVVDEDTLVVVSSDFTHYGPRFGYVPFTGDIPASIERLDREAFERIRACDARGFAGYVKRTGATICGRRPIEVLLRMLPEDAEAGIEAYDTSGALTGDWSHSVSYVSAVFRVDAWPRTPGAAPAVDAPSISAEDRAFLLDLARRAIRAGLKGGEGPRACDPDIVARPALHRPGAVFVTLRRKGALRGCIGQIRARYPLWKAVAHAAASAAFEDRRFEPVRPAEVDELEIKISALTPSRPVASWREIEAGRHGIILVKGPRAATFLPEVAVDQGWDLETALSMLASKAGLAPDEWREGARFEVFESESFGGDRR